jgi:HEAT repeat protein
MGDFSSRKVEGLRKRRDVPGLVQVLAGGPLRERRAAANTLIEIPDRRALTGLVAALGDEDEAVRRNVALALGELDDPRSEGELDAIVEPLVAALQDPAPLVRVSAASALGRMKSERAVEPLEHLAQDDPDELVRKTAAAVLRGFRASGG